METPKILILIMSCNKDFFKQEENVLKETYLKRLENYSNVDYFIYTSSENGKEYIDDNILYVDAPDDFNGTWEKTYKCFKYISKFDFDYVIKTNTSTFINIDLMVNLLQYMFNIKSKQILSADFVRTQKFGFGCSGNATILRKEDIDNIVSNYISIEDFKKENNIENHIYIGDDIILNSIIFRGLDTPEKIIDKFALIKGVYYKDDTKKNHIYYIGEENLEKLKDSIFITFRKHILDSYLDRETFDYRKEEIDECRKLDKLFDSYKYSPYDIIRCLIEYSNKRIFYFDLEQFRYFILTNKDEEENGNK